MRGWAAGGLLLLWGVCNTFSLEIKVNPEVRAFVDEQVTLKCSFRSFSPITEKLTVDWTYQPLTGGHTQTIFHFQSVAYPAVAGTFRGRILWVGNIGKGDASIAIQNLTLNDNGTFTCAVKNPPDVHHNIPQTKLTVTHRRFSSQLMSAVLLSILVFLPSAIVVILLLVRMGRKFGVLKHQKKSGYKKSSIEVSDDELEHSEPGTCLGKMGTWCLHCVVSSGHR
ncbi:myelin protein zero-like protein 3 isoform X2 [Pelodiscus sinensis]|uniref:myelin protein zero-like protein 3 isoform X2 n=1 Tax=Pelodiscus sinensis TaxID=13735 RepID=UPI003F6CCE0B